MPFGSLLLIIPPQLLVMEGFRSGLVALASYVKRKFDNLDVHLLDLSSVEQARIAGHLDRALSDLHGQVIAGVSTVTADYHAALSVMRELKKLDKRIVTVMGGHHASSDAEVVLRHHEDVDYVICNEGEIPLYHLIKSYPAVDRVPGLAFRNNGSGFTRNPDPPLLSTPDLDQVPLVYEGWELKRSPGKFDHVTYVSARGCPLSCAFCVVGNQEIRSKSIAQVKADLRCLVESGFSKVAIEDNFFAHKTARTLGVCRALEELRESGLHFTWDCQTRVESMDRPGIIEAMERAGCDAVYLGVESLDEQSLKFLGKTPNPTSYLRRLERVVPNLLASKIDCFINLQFGLPGEAEDQIERTLQRMKELGDRADDCGRRITVFPQLFVVYPGTFHFLEFARAKLYSRDVFEDFTQWEAEQRPILKWLGTTFAHGTGGLPLGILDDLRLREGKFSVDGVATARVTDTIGRISELRGVKVFQYGEYLVKENSNDSG